MLKNCSLIMNLVSINLEVEKIDNEYECNLSTYGYIPRSGEREFLREWFDFLDSMSQKEFDSYRLKYEREVLDPDYSGYIYIMKDMKLNRFKIGRSKNPKSRLSSLRSVHKNIELIGTRFCKDAKDAEECLHQKFKHRKQHVYREWFSLSEDDIESILHDENYITSEKILRMKEKHKEEIALAHHE